MIRDSWSAKLICFLSLIGFPGRNPASRSSKGWIEARRLRAMAIQVSVSGHLIPEPDTRCPGLQCPFSYKSLNYMHLILALTLAR